MSASNIAEFFSGKKVFLTGGSGFVGKCVAWKLINSCPDIEKVYLLLRGRSEQEFQKKFQNIIDSEIFEIIRKENLQLLSKLEGVQGDVTAPLCGLNPGHLKNVEGVEIFIHCAATTNLIMRLPKIMQINVGGTKNVLELASRSTAIKAFIHVSTAYCMPPGPMDEKVYPTDIEPEEALDCFAKMPTDWSSSVTKLILKDEINTYSYAKHMGERMVERASNNLPVAIVRPGAISSSRTEPLPGWNETQSSSSHWAKLAFSGAYHTILGNRQVTIAITPVDYVVNTCLAAAWRLGTAFPKECHVYNCVPNHKTNPIKLREFIKWGCQTTRESLDVKKIPNYHPLFSKNVGLFLANNYLFRKIPGQIWSLMKEGSVGEFQKQYSQAQLIAKAFQPVTTLKWEFSTAKLVELNQLMDPLDRKLFPFDFDKIDWKLFINDFAHGLYSYNKDLVDSSRKLPGEHNVGFVG